MSFSPVVPLPGLAGWRFLDRTGEAQRAAFVKNPALERDTTYFRSKVAEIGSAEALVSDRRLMQVALGAFGLDADINNRFFIRKVLEDGTVARDALANRLSDKRYLALARAFGLGDPGSLRTAEPGFADSIVRAFEDRQFEVAIGRQDENLRLALNMERELPRLASATTSERARWFGVLGDPPLRRVFETAFGLPPSFAAIDLDRQVDTLQARSRAAFGTDKLEELAAPDRREALIRRFLLRGQFGAEAAGSAPASAALALLRSPRWPGGAVNLPPPIVVPSLTRL